MLIKQSPLVKVCIAVQWWVPTPGAHEDRNVFRLCQGMIAAAKYVANAETPNPKPRGNKGRIGPQKSREVRQATPRKIQWSDWTLDGSTMSSTKLVECL